MFWLIRKLFKKNKQNNKLIKQGEVNFKSKNSIFNAYFNLMNLFFKSFIRNFRNVFFVFVMPVFFMVIFFFVLRGIYGDQTNIVKAGYILLGPMTAGITSLSTNIAEWKNSIFLKRLDVTPVKKSSFLITLITFYFFISLISAIWLLIWTIIIDPSNTINYLPKVNWGYFILGIILFILASISIGIFIGGISNSVGMAQAVALSLYFPSMFLSGIMIPGYVIASARDVFNYIGYIFPHKYAATIAIYGWNINISPQIIDGPQQSISLIKALGFPALYIPIITSCVWSALILTLTGITFKWDIRN